MSLKLNVTKIKQKQLIGLNDVLSLFKGPDDMAHHLGLSRQTIYRWISIGKIPAERLIEVRYVTGLEPYYIRPDLFMKIEDLHQPHQSED